MKKMRKGLAFLLIAVLCSAALAAVLSACKREEKAVLGIDPGDREVFVQYGDYYETPPAYVKDQRGLIYDWEVTSAVYDSVGAEVKTAFGRFRPDKGSYSVVFTAYEDQYPAVTVPMTCADTAIPAIRVTDFRSWALVGDEAYLPIYELSDASGVDNAYTAATVTAPDGSAVAVAGGKFTAAQTGAYSVAIRVRDVDGNAGEYTYSLYCMEEFEDATLMPLTLMDFDEEEYIKAVLAEYGYEAADEFAIVTSDLPDSRISGGALKIAIGEDKTVAYGFHLQKRLNIGADGVGKVVFKFYNDALIEDIYVYDVTTNKQYARWRYTVEGWHELSFEPRSAAGWDADLGDLRVVIYSEDGAAIWLDEIAYAVQWKDEAIGDNVVADFDEAGYSELIAQNSFATTAVQQVIPEGDPALSEVPAGYAGGVLKVTTTANFDGFQVTFNKPVSYLDVSQISVRMYLSEGPNNSRSGFILNDGTVQSPFWGNALTGPAGGYRDGWHTYGFSGTVLTGQLGASPLDPNVVGFYFAWYNPGATHAKVIYVDEISYTLRDTSVKFNADGGVNGTKVLADFSQSGTAKNFANAAQQSPTGYDPPHKFPFEGTVAPVAGGVNVNIAIGNFWTGVKYQFPGALDLQNAGAHKIYVVFESAAASDVRITPAAWTAGGYYFPPDGIRQGIAAGVNVLEIDAAAAVAGGVRMLHAVGLYFNAGSADIVLKSIVYGASAEQRPPMPLGTPASASFARDAGNSRYNVTWAAVPGASDYAVSVNGGAAQTVSGTSTAVGYGDEGLVTIAAKGDGGVTALDGAARALYIDADYLTEKADVGAIGWGGYVLADFDEPDSILAGVSKAAAGPYDFNNSAYIGNTDLGSTYTHGAVSNINASGTGLRVTHNAAHGWANWSGFTYAFQGGALTPSDLSYGSDRSGTLYMKLLFANENDARYMAAYLGLTSGGAAFPLDTQEVAFRTIGAGNTPASALPAAPSKNYYADFGQAYGIIIAIDLQRFFTANPLAASVSGVYFGMYKGNGAFVVDSIWYAPYFEAAPLLSYRRVDAGNLEVTVTPLRGQTVTATFRGQPVTLSGNKYTTSNNSGVFTAREGASATAQIYVDADYLTEQADLGAAGRGGYVLADFDEADSIVGGVGQAVKGPYNYASNVFYPTTNPASAFGHNTVTNSAGSGTGLYVTTSGVGWERWSGFSYMFPGALSKSDLLYGGSKAGKLYMRVLYEAAATPSWLGSYFGFVSGGAPYAVKADTSTQHYKIGSGGVLSAAKNSFNNYLIQADGEGYWGALIEIDLDAFFTEFPALASIDGLYFGGYNAVTYLVDCIYYAPSVEAAPLLSQKRLPSGNIEVTVTPQSVGAVSATFTPEGGGAGTVTLTGGDKYETAVSGLFSAVQANSAAAEVYVDKDYMSANANLAAAGYGGYVIADFDEEGGGTYGFTDVAKTAYNFNSGAFSGTTRANIYSHGYMQNNASDTSPVNPISGTGVIVTPDASGNANVGFTYLFPGSLAKGDFGAAGKLGFKIVTDPAYDAMFNYGNSYVGLISGGAAYPVRMLTSVKRWVVLNTNAALSVRTNSMSDTYFPDPGGADGWVIEIDLDSFFAQAENAGVTQIDGLYFGSSLNSRMESFLVDCVYYTPAAIAQTRNEGGAIEVSVPSLGGMVSAAFTPEGGGSEAASIAGGVFTTTRSGVLAATYGYGAGGGMTRSVYVDKDYLSFNADIAAAGYGGYVIADFDEESGGTYGFTNVSAKVYYFDNENPVGTNAIRASTYTHGYMENNPGGTNKIDGTGIIVTPNVTSAAHMGFTYTFPGSLAKADLGDQPGKLGFKMVTDSNADNMFEYGTNYVGLISGGTAYPIRMLTTVKRWVVLNTNAAPSARTSNLTGEAHYNQPGGADGWVIEIDL
ncbi:MAG: hypothetical protein LBL66_00865, partial [Clostridiales bacterium]|nr:hypothetical protein [Clostridiales bacterium]